MRNKHHTAAILASSVLAGGAAQGAIVYTNFNNLTIVGRDGTASFDLSAGLNSRFSLLYQDENSQKPEVKGDGIHSFVLARTWQDTNAMDLNHRTYGGLPVTPAGVRVDSRMRDVNPGKQQNGITNLTVQVNGYFVDRPDNTDADDGGSESVYNVGDWGKGPVANSGYVGLVLVNGGITNFGWAHFEWSVPSTRSDDLGAQLTIVDGAYQSTPNTGILTGDGAPVVATPETAEEWFELFQAKNDWTWSGSDQTTSYQASNGKVYWLFGDTILGTRNPATGGYDPGWVMVPNSILIESDGLLSGATPNAPAVPRATNGDRYWIQGIFEANGYMYGQCARVQKVEEGLGFLPYGAELAKFRIEPTGQLTFLGMIATPGTGIPESVGVGSIQWTRDVVVDDGYVYIFGDTRTGIPLSPKASYVSRVAEAQVENPSAWRFWDGSSWGTNITNSVAIIPDMISSVRLYSGRWVVLYKPFAGSGDRVKAAIASAPQGPYGSTQVLFMSPGGEVTNGVTTDLHCYRTYSPQAHPQYPLTSGKLLVSIAWNGCDLFQDTANDARLYKARFYEVALAGVPVYLNGRLSEGQLILSWPSGTLLEADTLNGPWTPTGTTSPYTNTLTSGSRFFRAQVQ